MPEVTAVFMATIAIACPAHAAISIPEPNFLKLEGAVPLSAALPIIRGGFGGSSETYGVPHG